MSINVRKKTSQSGFTLVELAIVLVIIGLIIGGVLVGQDLIKAAEIRATISDLEKFNSAATTFKGKYNALPGDMLPTTATAFGFQTRSGASGHGDGNGLIDDGSALTLIAGESATFWTDLSDAQLVAGAYANANADTAGNCATLDTCLPRTKVRPTTYNHIYTTNGRNFFYLARLTLISVPSSGLTPTAGLQVSEAYNIDTKMDDGAPDIGSVVANSNFNNLNPGAPSATGVCRDTTPTPDTYNIAAALASEVNCQLKIRANF